MDHPNDKIIWAILNLEIPEISESSEYLLAGLSLLLNKEELSEVMASLLPKKFWAYFGKLMKEYFTSSEPPPKIAYAVLFPMPEWFKEYKKAKTPEEREKFVREVVFDKYIKAPIFFVDPPSNERKEFEARLDALQKMGTVIYDKVEVDGKEIYRIYITELFPSGRKLLDKIKDFRKARRSKIKPKIEEGIGKDLETFRKNYEIYKKWEESLPDIIKKLFILLNNGDAEEAYKHLKDEVFKYLSLHGPYRDFYNKFTKAIDKALEEIKKLKDTSDDYRPLKDRYKKLLSKIKEYLEKNPEVIGNPAMKLLIALLSEIFDALAKDAEKIEGDPKDNLKEALFIIKKMYKKYRAFYEIFREDLSKMLSLLAKILKEEIEEEYVIKFLREYIIKNIEKIKKVIKELGEDLEKVGEKINNKDINNAKTPLQNILVSLKVNVGPIILEMVKNLEKDKDYLSKEGYESLVKKIVEVEKELLELYKKVNEISKISKEINNMDDDTFKGFYYSLNAFIYNLSAFLLKILEEYG